MKKAIKISIIFAFIAIGLVSGTHAQNLALTTKKSGKAVKHAATGYFYFQIDPTSDKPYYFSQSIAVIYADQKDLDRQCDAYLQKLRDKAKKDGNGENYNQKSSVEVATLRECDANRTKDIADLKLGGAVVIEMRL